MTISALLWYNTTIKQTQGRTQDESDKKASEGHGWRNHYLLQGVRIDMETLRKRVSKIAVDMMESAREAAFARVNGVPVAEVKAFAREIESAVAEDGMRREKAAHWVPLSYLSAACSYCGGTMATPFATEEDARAKWNFLPDYCGCCGSRMEELGYDGPDKKTGNR